MNIEDMVRVLKIPPALPKGNVENRTMFKSCLGESHTIWLKPEPGECYKCEE